MAELTRRGAAALLFGAGLAAAAPAFAQTGLALPPGFRTPPARLDSRLRRIIGRLPAGFEGVLFRNGPAQFERAGERLGHWFDGDGMVQRFAISNSGIVHRGRFVDTDKRRDEEEAGRFLYPGFGFQPENMRAPRRNDDVNAANTSVLPMGDEVWALWEGGSPYQLEADTLNTIGRRNFGGQLDGAPFSAHPKRDPVSGEIWNFGAFGRHCMIWRLGPDGAVRDSQMIELPQAGLMHDCVITERSVVLLVPPFVQTPGRHGALVDQFEWRPDQPMIALALDKNDLTQQRRFDLPARFLFHFGNAWEDDAGTIRLDACLYQDASFAFESARDFASAGSLDARPTQVTLENGAGSYAELEGRGEFPRIDPRLVGRRHRYSWGVVPHGIARWDWESGERRAFSYGADYHAEEPIYIPRPNGQEGEGWVIATVLNMRADRTELALFDAARIEDGPLALYACDYPLPLGFHGAFTPA